MSTSNTIYRISLRVYVSFWALKIKTKITSTKNSDGKAFNIHDKTHLLGKVVPDIYLCLHLLIIDTFVKIVYFSHHLNTEVHQDYSYICICYEMHIWNT